MKYRSLLFSPALALAAALALSSCSINRLATRAAANALSGAGSGDVFTGDSDPELVGGALPVAIKVYEALLAQEPEHQGLILTTGSLFVMYANAFVQGPADLLGIDDYLDKDARLARSKRLYLRGVAILVDGLERRCPGFAAALAGDSLPALDAVLSRMTAADVPALYWTVAGTLAAYSVDVFDFGLSAQLSGLGALLRRAYALDPDYDAGALDEFYVQFYGALHEVEEEAGAGPGSLQVMPGADRAKAQAHFDRALAKKAGAGRSAAGLYIAYAEAVCKPAQDYAGFMDYIDRALAVDPDDDRASRLVTILAQRKAAFLRDNVESYFSEDAMNGGVE